MQIELTNDQLNKIAEIVSDRVLAQLKPINKVSEESETMTIKDVADYLKKSVTSIRRYIRKLDFPTARKVGGEFRFDRKEVKQWWEYKKNRAEKVYKAK